MQSDLSVRRRLYVLSYKRYLAADKDWTAALNAASEIVPNVVGRGYWRLGTSKSRLRRLYLERDRSLQRLMVARLKLNVAKARLTKKANKPHRVKLLVDLR